MSITGPAGTLAMAGPGADGKGKDCRAAGFPLAERPNRMRFGDRLGRTLALIWLCWLLFASLDFWLTGQPFYALYLGLAGTPVILLAGFALVHPLLLLSSRLAGWPAASTRGMAAAQEDAAQEDEVRRGWRARAAFWLLLAGLPWAAALAGFLPYVAEIDLVGRDLCRFEPAVAGQSAGLALPSGEAGRAYCRLDPVLATIAVLPLPLAVVMLTAVLLTLVRGVFFARRLAPGRSGPGPDAGFTNPLPGVLAGTAAPLLTGLYILALGLLLATGPSQASIKTLWLVILFAPLLALAGLPPAWALIWLGRRLCRVLRPGAPTGPHSPE